MTTNITRLITTLLIGASISQSLIAHTKLHNLDGVMDAAGQDNADAYDLLAADNTKLHNLDWVMDAVGQDAEDAYDLFAADYQNWEKLVNVTNKDVVNGTATVVTSNENDDYDISIPCKYFQHIELDQVGEDSLVGMKVEDYSLTADPTLNKQCVCNVHIDIPAYFRNNKETSKYLNDFLNDPKLLKYVDHTTSPLLSQLSHNDPDDDSAWSVEAGKRLKSIHDVYSADILKGALGNGDLYIARVLRATPNGHYRPAKVDGHQFGIYEIPYDTYQDLCERCRDSNQPAPVILFEKDGLSFKVADHSELRPDPEHPGYYLLDTSDDSVA